jgi:hypothetical protein
VGGQGAVGGHTQLEAGRERRLLLLRKPSMPALVLE